MKPLQIFVLVCFTSLECYSQVVTITYADSLFRYKNWTAAAEAYEKITLDNPNPKTGLAFNRLGTSYYYLGRFTEAVPAYKRAIAISSNPIVMYYLARVYLTLNKTDSCYQMLEQASLNGFNQYHQLKEDRDFQTVRNDLRFERILEKVKLNAMPCLRESGYRQFDFWIGSWNVVDSKTNQSVGSSEITSILDECVIMENWMPINGVAGKSFNMYLVGDHKWRQTYVDANGTFSEYYDGEFTDQAMRFKLKMAPGDSTLKRMTFYVINKDCVRQLGELSKDGGVTWESEFDLTYGRNINH